AAAFLEEYPYDQRQAARDDHPARLGDERNVAETPLLGLAHDLGDQRSRLGNGHDFPTRIMPVWCREAAADIESDDRHARPGAHPCRLSERALVRVGILHLAADVKAEPDPKSDPGDALCQLDRVRRPGSELLGQLVSGMAARREADE